MIEFDKIREVHALVESMFRGNPVKTAEWFNTPNILLGGLSPNQMVHDGRIHKLILYVKGAIYESKRPR